MAIEVLVQFIHVKSFRHHQSIGSPHKKFITYRILLHFHGFLSVHVHPFRVDWFMLEILGETRSYIFEEDIYYSQTMAFHFHYYLQTWLWNAFIHSTLIAAYLHTSRTLSNAFLYYTFIQQDFGMEWMFIVKYKMLEHSFNHKMLLNLDTWKLPLINMFHCTAYSNFIGQCCSACSVLKNRGPSQLIKRNIDHSFMQSHILASKYR